MFYLLFTLITSKQRSRTSFSYVTPRSNIVSSSKLASRWLSHRSSFQFLDRGSSQTLMPKIPKSSSGFTLLTTDQLPTSRFGILFLYFLDIRVWLNQGDTPWSLTNSSREDVLKSQTNSFRIYSWNTKITVFRIDMFITPLFTSTSIRVPSTHVHAHTHTNIVCYMSYITLYITHT